MAEERVDADGVWRLAGDGVTEMLVEPSQAWLNRRDEMAAQIEAADDPPDPVQAAVARIEREIGERLTPSSVNSIAEVKAAILEGLAAATG